MLKATTTLVLLLCIVGISCHRVFPWGEPYILHPNNGYISQIQLFFSLESPLPKGHVLRVQLPFTTAPAISGVSVYAQTGTRGTVIAPTAGAIDGSIKFAQAVSPFNTYFTFGSDLSPFVNYVLKITLSISPTDVGWLGYIQMETMSPANSIASSSAKDTPITYDLNNAFAPVHIFAAPGQPIFALGTTDASAATSTRGSTYTQPLKIQLSSDFWFWPTFEINWSGSDNFQFSNCVNVDAGTSSTVTALPTSAYTCTISLPDKRILINHNQPVLKTQTLTYSITITNPSNGGSTSLSLKVYHRFNKNLTDYAGNAISLSVPVVPATSITMSSVKPLLSWGIDRVGLSSGQQNIFQLFASGADTTQVFQGVRFYFTLSGALSVNTYQVVLQLCTTTANCLILENSIDHNLGSGVTCTVDQTTTGVYVKCPGVPSIQQSNNYIGVRTWFHRTNVVSSSNVVNDTSFGSITINQLVGDSYTSYISAISIQQDYKSILATQPQAKQILVNQNGNGPIFATSDATTWGYVYGASGQNDITDANSAGVKSLLGGIFVSNSSIAPTMNVALITGLKLADDWIGSTNLTAFGGASGSNLLTQSGLDVLMNPNLWDVAGSVDKTTCAAGNDGNTGSGAFIKPTATEHCHCWSAVSTVGAGWTRLRWVYTGADVAASAYDSGTGSPNSAFSIFWPGFVKLKSVYSGTSLRADSLIPDYYAVLYRINGSNTVAVRTNSTANSSDLGEIGGSILTPANVSIGQKLFWSQYFLSPLTATSSTTSPNYASIKTWLAGWSADATNAASWDSNGAFSILRIRGFLNSTADFYPSNSKLALFFRIDAAGTQSASYKPLKPVGTDSKEQFSCFMGATPGKCVQDRQGRQLWATATNPAGLTSKMVNYLDYYQVISTDLALSSSTNSSIGIITKYAYLSGNPSTAVGYYRLGFVPSTGLYYIAGEDMKNGITSSGATVAVSNATCDTSTNAPGVGPVFGVTSYIVSQSIQNMTVNYQSTLTVGTTNGYGGLSWCAQWNFLSSNFAFNTSSTSGLENTIDKCTSFTYVSDVSTGTNWYCIYCPVGIGATSPPVSSTNSFKITNFMAADAINIGTPSFGLVWGDEGAYTKRAYCSSFTAAFTASQTIVGSTGGSSFAQLGQKVVVSITLGTTITGVTSIVLEGRSQTTPANIDNSFPQSTLDTNAEIWLLSTTDTLVKDYIKLTGVSISGGSITLPISGLGSTKLTRNSWQIIIWGLNGNTAPSPVPANQYFTIKSIRGSLAEISASPSNPTAAQLIAWQFLNPITNFSVVAPQYTRPILNSAGSFRWDFSYSTNRPWYYSDHVVFSLDAFSTASQNANANTLKCRITDSKDVLRQTFSSCTLTAPNLTIVGLPFDLLTTSLDFTADGIRIYIDGVRAIGAQATQTINGKILFGGTVGGTTISLTKSTTTADVNTPTDLTTKAFPTGYPALTKMWPYPNGNTLLAFNLITNVQLSEKSRITVEFPTYYNPGLTTRSQYPFCTVNELTVNCMVAGPRSLQVDGLPGSVYSGNSFVLKVYGITSPSSSSTTDVFWIQLNSDRSDTASTVIYASALSDTANQAQTITPLHVNWVNVSLTATRAAATYTWAINPIGKEDNDVNRSVHVIFPEHWGLSWGIFTPACSVVDYATPTTIYTKPQTIFGDLVMLNLSQTLPQNRIVNLVCDNVRTPDNETTYPSQDIQIRIVDINATRIYQHSASSVHNVNWGLAFTNNPNIQYIEWTGTPSTFSNPVRLTRGTFGPAGGKLKFNIPNRASKSLGFRLQPTFFVPSVAPLEAAVGTADVSFFIGCPSSTPLNRYGLTLGLNESSTYVLPKPLYINVTLDKVNVDVSPSTDISLLVITKATTKSAPVRVDVSGAPPFSDITITPTGPATTNFSVNPASVKLSLEKPWGTFVFSTTSNTVVGESGEFVFTITGTDSAAYNQPRSIIVKGAQDVNNEGTATPILTIAVDPSDQNKATFKTLQFSLSKVSQANVFVGCQIDGTTFPSQDVMVAAAQANNPMKKTDKKRAYFESFFMSTSTQQWVIKNLKPDKGFECRAIATSVTGVNSTIASIRFKSASNGQQTQRYMFDFGAALSRSHIQVLLCAIIQYIRYPAENIQSENGEYCGWSPARAITTSKFALFVFPLEVESDAVGSRRNLQTINQINLNSSTLLNSINATLVAAGAAPIKTVSLQGTVSNNAVTFNTTALVSSDYNWTSISNIVLSANGYIYCALSQPGSTVPSALDLHASVGNASATPSGVISTQSVYYSATTGPASVNFSSLPANTTYKLYLVASNEDPSPYANFTNVSAFDAQTKTIITTVSAMTLLVSAMMTFAVMLLLLL